MRVLALVFAVLLGACTTAVDIDAVTGGSDADIVGPNPFPIARGSALPPPGAGASGQTAPPEGVTASGFDFGHWRDADSAGYGPHFQAQIRQRYAGQNSSQIRADLERNGFACEEQDRIDCRIEIMERQCAMNWYVVVQAAGAELAAGFETMCLGAR